MLVPGVEPASHVSNPFTNLSVKMRAYVANGARLAVLIDPERRAVEVFVPNRPPEVLEPARSVSCDPVLPGFTLDLRPIFA
jgi:Uma2 family endonuclease